MASKEELDRLATKNANRKAKDVKRWVKTLDNFLENNAGKVLRKLQAKEGGLTNLSAAAALGQLEDALIEAGLSDVVDQAIEIYRDVVNQVRAEVKAAMTKDVNFARVFKEQIDQFISLKNQAVTKTILNYVDDVRLVVAEQVLLNQKPDFAELAGDASARTIRNLESDMVSEVAAFHRQVQWEASNEIDAEYFLYHGHLQDNSRKFCIVRAGKVFRRDTIESWDNGQGLPVIPYLGGYRCQHQLLPVRPEDAKRIGVSEL